MSHRSAPPARGRVRTFLAALLSLLLLGVGITTASADVVDDAEATPAQEGTWELSQQAAPASGATVEAGEQITYTLSAAALDTRPVQGIAATVDLSGVLAHASLVEPLHRELSLTGDDLTWEVRNPVRINRPATVSFSVVVDSDASGVTLTSVAAPQSSGGTCTDCTITHTVPGEPSWDLSVTPNEEPGSTLLTNAAIVPSMTATNTSDVTVSDAQVVADLTGMGQHWDLGTLREGVSYDADTNRLTWDVPEMEPGESLTQRFQVRLRAPARGSEVSLDFTAQGAGGECVTGCELGYHVFGFDASVTADPAAGEVTAGQQITYTWTAQNISGGELTGAHMRANLRHQAGPFLDAADLVEPLDEALEMFGSVLHWNIPDLAPGESAQITFVAQVHHDATPGDAVRMGISAGTARHGGSLVDPATLVHTVAEPTWELSHSAEPVSGSAVAPGEQITYTLTAAALELRPVTRVAASVDLSEVLSGASLVEPLPPGLSLDGDDLTWTVRQPVHRNHPASVSYTVTVDDDASGATLTSVATPQRAGALCTDCTLTHTVVEPAWEVSARAAQANGVTIPNEGTVRPNGQLNYHLSAENTSAVTVSDGVVVADVSGLVAYANIEAVGEGAEFDADAGVVRWSVPELAAQESASVRFRANLRFADAPNAVLPLSVSTEGAGGECVSGCELVHYATGFEASMTTDPPAGSVEAGDEITYTWTVQNTSQAQISGATVTAQLRDVLEHAELVEPLAEELRLVSIVGPTIMRWDVPDLGPEEAAEVSFSVIVDDDAAVGAQLATSITAGANSFGITYGDREATHTVAVPAWELQVRPNQQPGSTLVTNAAIVSSMTATNTSDVVVTGAQVVADLTGMGQHWDLGSLPEGVSYDAEAALLTWDVPDMQPGESASERFQVRVRAPARGSEIALDFTAEGAGGECVTGCELTYHVAGFDASVAADPPAGPVGAGDEITYTWTAQNISGGQLTGAYVRANLRHQAGPLLEAADLVEPLDEAFEMFGSVLHWNIPDLGPGESAQVTFRVTVHDDAAADAVIRMGISPSTAQGGRGLDPATLVHTVVEPAWEVSARAAQANGVTIPNEGTVRPNGQLNYHLSAENTSAVTISDGVVVADVSGLVAYANIEAVGEGAEFDADAGVVRWSVPELAAQESASVRFRANLRFADAPNAVLPLSVSTEGAGGECVSGCELVHFATGFEASMSTDPPAGSVEAGDEITYTWTVQNTSQAQISGATVTAQLRDVLEHAELVEPLAEELRLVSIVGPTIMRWDVPDLAAHESAEVSFSVIVDDDAAVGAELATSITAGANSFGITYGDREVTHTVDQLSWEVSVRGAQANGVTIPPEGTLRPNGQVNYHVVAENTSGLTMSEGAVIADVSGLLPYADIEALTAGAEFDPENGLVRWWAPELSGGESASFSFRANLRFADAPGAVLPLSVITQGPGGECASGCELVHYVTAFEASVSADPPSGEVRAGDEVTYTWQVRNTSQAQISGAYVRAQMSGVLAHADLVEPLPDGVDFTIGTVLNWWVPDLGPGESAQVSFTVVVDQDAEQGTEFGMSITAGANSFGITYGDQEVDHTVSVSVTPPAPSLPPVLAVLLGLAKWVFGFLIWLF